MGNFLFFFFWAVEECACAMAETNELTGKLLVSQNFPAKIVIYQISRLTEKSYTFSNILIIQ